MQTFNLPPVVTNLVRAAKEVRAHYRGMLSRTGSGVDLKFTLDGNLVGDLGEALAVELFSIRLVETAATEGIDGYAPDGRTVQVKATGTRRGPAFRFTETRADHLLFFDLDFERAKGLIVFNGPEHYAVKRLPAIWTGQRSLTAAQILAADAEVPAGERLPIATELSADGQF